MSHVAKEKPKLLNRLRGQIDAIERSVAADHECADVLQQATSCRVVAAEELVEIVHAYLKK